MCRAGCLVAVLALLGLPGDPASAQVASGVDLVRAGSDFAYHGDTVTYDFTVTNTGAFLPLSNVVLTDNKCTTIVGPDTGADASPSSLDPGESWTYTCTMPVPAHIAGEENPIVSTACVEALDAELGVLLNDCADHSTRILHPAVDIETTGPETATEGDLVVFTMAVTDPGDQPLSNVAITAPRCSEAPSRTSVNGDPTADVLDPGDRWSYECRVQTALGDREVINLATVTGTDPHGRRPTDADDARTVLATRALPSKEVEHGTARIARRTGCAANVFHVTVRGSRIRSVTFTIDGAHRKVLTRPTKGDRYMLRVNPRAFKTPGHMVRAVVRFAAASQTPSRRFRLRFARCAQKRPAPLFAG
jgi:hypothetical protein